MARRYGKLPSEICDRTIEQYNLDLLVASEGMAEDVKSANKLKDKNKLKSRYVRR